MTLGLGSDREKNNGAKGQFEFEPAQLKNSTKRNGYVGFDLPIAISCALVTTFTQRGLCQT